MSVEIRVPRLAESISDAVLVEWLKPDQAAVGQDEPVATLETDKAAVEIAAGAAGRLSHGSRPGDRVIVGQVIGTVEPGAGVPAARVAPAVPAPPAAPVTAAPTPATRTEATPAESAGDGGEPMLSPAVRRLIEEHGLDPLRIRATGRGGRLIKEDVLRHLEEAGSALRAPAASSPPVPAPPPAADPAAGSAAPEAAGGAGEEEEERSVPMSRIRLRIAERLVRAQHTAAILTTFNEIDMTAVQELRARYRESFEKRHGVRLGLLSFFARASTLALADIPAINAEIRDTDIVYRKHVHLGIAVGTDRGLVVPVVRGADRLDFAGLEREIARLAARARDRSLTLDELSGGTFTLSNGGVYGSLLSTPILNPPQSGILGLHKIQKRPVAADDQVVIRPMMYVALSYDHRIVDGEQAVSFLIRIKERLEDPERMLLDV